MASRRCARWSSRLPTASIPRAAIKKVFSSDIDALQTTFDAFLTERFASLRRALDAPEGFEPDQPIEKLKAAAVEHPDSFAVQMALGRALRGSDPAGAIAAFERAIKLVPMITGPESPYMQIVEVAMAAGDKAKAAEALEAMTAQDHTAVDAARQLVGLLDPDKDKDRLRIALAARRRHRSVRFARRTRRSVAWLLRRVTRLRRCEPFASRWPPVQSTAPRHTRIWPRVLFQGGNRAEAKREALAALEIAPTYERAQAVAAEAG